MSVAHTRFALNVKSRLADLFGDGERGYVCRIPARNEDVNSYRAAHWTYFARGITLYLHLSLARIALNCHQLHGCLARRTTFKDGTRFLLKLFSASLAAISLRHGKHLPLIGFVLFLLIGTTIYSILRAWGHFVK